MWFTVVVPQPVYLEVRPAFDGREAEMLTVTYGDPRWGYCDCGCGQRVSRNFRPGHDARLKARLVRFASCHDERAEQELRDRGWLQFLRGTPEWTAAQAARGTRTRVRRTPVDLTARTFGVEIEFVGISKERAFAALHGAGVNVRSETYNHRTRTYWKLITDQSVSGGYECVSPVLRGEAGFEQVALVCDALRNAGATVNRACGTHVHHGVQDLTGPQLGQLIQFYAGHQMALSTLVAPSRRGSCTYCLPWTIQEVATILDEFTQSRRPRSSWSRFRTINVMSFPKYGTIEVRQHQGTLSGKKIKHWVLLGQAMIRAVQAGATVRTDLVGMLTDLDLTDETRIHLVQRARDLGTSVPPTPWEEAA
jgi:hypothetical protein